MEPFFVRYRNVLVLLALLVAQIAGLAVQVRRTDAGHINLDARDASGVRLIRLWANAIVSPPERAVQTSKSGVGGVWQTWFDLRHVRQENKDLQDTVDRLRLEQAALLEDARQGERLQSLLNFQQRYIYQTVPAQVIGGSASDLSRVFYIDKGADYKLERDMAVITPEGIVGKVREVFPHSAQVLVISDQSSGAGVILESTRIRGILRGNAAGQPQIIGVLADQRIQPGEKVLTAGGDQIFPRGLPVGVVSKVVRDPDRDGFIQVIVQPAAHLDRLDEVLVITSTQSRFSDKQMQDIADSKDLKGPDAAALEEQKKASEIMAERLPGLIEPNLPADQQPLHDSTNPTMVAHPPLAIHPDRFTPGAAQDAPETPNGAPGAVRKPPTSAPSAPATRTPKIQSGAGEPNPAGPKSPAKPQPTPPQREQ